MLGGQNWILPKEVNADYNWLEIWKNHICPSVGPNGGSAASASGVSTMGSKAVDIVVPVIGIGSSS